MDPISIGLGIVGLGISLFGQTKSITDSRHLNQLHTQEAGVETQVNEQRKEAMELGARRQQLEIVRNQQKIRALALNSATNQGAEFGSGLQGGYGQISGQTGVNLTGISQNLEIGRNIFSLNNQISGIKLQESQEQSKIAEDQGWQSLGGSIMKAGPTLGALSQNIFGSSSSGQNWGSIQVGNQFFPSAT